MSSNKVTHSRLIRCCTGCTYGTWWLLGVKIFSTGAKETTRVWLTLLTVSFSSQWVCDSYRIATTTLATNSAGSMFEDVFIEQTLHDNLGFEQGIGIHVKLAPVTDCSATGTGRCCYSAQIWSRNERQFLLLIFQIFSAFSVARARPFCEGADFLIVTECCHCQN